MTKQIALGTRANRGIGFEVVQQLATKGYRLLLTSRDLEKTNKVAQALIRQESKSS